MNNTDYKYSHKGDDYKLNFFSNNPISKWSFELFFESINENKRRITKKQTLLNSYLDKLNIIYKDPETPQEIKSHVNNLIQKNERKDQETKNSVNYTITGNNSVYIGDNNNIDNSHVHNRQKQEEKKGDSEEKEIADEHIYEEEYIYEESDDDNDNIPSDLTIDHHPGRECQYFFDHEVASDHEEIGEEDEWVVRDLCVSEKCRSLKDNILKLEKDLGSLSDIRLLAINDIFLFDSDINMSASKYFGLEEHKVVISSLDIKKYRPKMSINAHKWCQEIVDDPPHDWVTSLAFGGKILSEAAKEKNDVDMHTAHVLCLILPLFVSESLDCSVEDSLDCSVKDSLDYSVEDSLVHNYLSHMLLSVFSKDGHFKIKWANGELKKSSKFKPDFMVYSISINIKCVLVIGEFKKSTNYSAIESDKVKLGKQMRITYNDLVLKRIPNPVVCGIICQGDEIITYFMDMQSPKQYRMVKISTVKLFKSLEELYFLPHIISSIVQLKNVALETSKKAEMSIIKATEKNHRNPRIPSTEWLSSQSYHLSRKRKSTFNE